VIPGARCAACGASWLQPASGCASCGGFEVEPCDLVGDGEVVGATTVHSSARTPSPWPLVQVRLHDGGVLVMGLADIRIEPGSRVTVDRLDQGVPVFALADPAS
jgi:uncharacterized OB-fold protein